MSPIFTRGNWRRAVGLIAAYSLALNVILASFAAHAVPDFSHSASVDPFSVICLSAAHSDAQVADSDGTSKQRAPAHHACGDCSLCAAAASAVPPFQVSLNLQFIVLQSTNVDVVHGPTAGIKSLPGQPRAPPQTA